MSEQVAEVRCSCGRLVLFVTGIAVAMQGDKCRDGSFPEECYNEIPQHELDAAYIGDKKSSELPIKLVRFFRGDVWNEKMLEYAAKVINEKAALAAAAVKVPEEVLEAAHGIDQMTPQMPYDPFLKQHRTVCNFILQLAGKDGA